MINFQLYFILIYLKIIINAECLQYLPELTQQPDKKKNKAKHCNENLQRKLKENLLTSNLKKQHT